MVAQDAGVAARSDILDDLRTFWTAIDQVAEKVHFIAFLRRYGIHQHHKAIVMAMDISNNNASIRTVSHGAMCAFWIQLGILPEVIEFLQFTGISGKS